MDFVITVFKNGGPFMYLLLLLFMLGPCPASIVAVIACVRLRVPGVLHLVVPAMLVGVGCLGTIVGVQMAMNALVVCSPEIRSVLGAVGWAVAHYTDLSGMFGAGLLLLCSSGLAAVGVAIGAGRDAKFVLLHSVPSLVVGGLAAIASLAWALFIEASLLPGLACGVGTITCAVAGLRWSADEKDGGRIAEGRLTVGLCAFLAVICLSYVSWLNGEIMAFDAAGKASPEVRAMLMYAGFQASSGALKVGLVASLGCLVAAAIPAAFSAKHLYNIWGAVSLTMLGGVLLLLCGVRVAQWAKLMSLHEVVTGGVLTELSVPGLPSGKNLEGYVQGSSAWGSCLVTVDGQKKTMGRLVLPSIPDSSWEPAVCPREPGPFKALGEEESALIAVAGRHPARWLASTRWYQDGAGPLSLLTDPSPEVRRQSPPKLQAYSHGAMNFQWQARPAKTQMIEVPHEEPGLDVNSMAELLADVFDEVPPVAGPDEFAFLDSPNGTIALANGQFQPVPTHAALQELLPRHPDYLEVHFYADRLWTIDDIVALCGSVDIGRRADCVICEETPAEWASRVGLELPW